MGTDEDWRRLGTALRLRREELRLTQRDVADRAEISQNTVKAFESGKRHSRYPGNLTSVAIALGWTPESPRSILDGGEPRLAAAASNTSRRGEQRIEELIQQSPELNWAEKRVLLATLEALREAYEDRGTGPSVETA